MKPNYMNASWFQDLLWTQKNNTAAYERRHRTSSAESQQLSCSAPPVSDSACPYWVCRATRKSPKMITQYAVFFGHERKLQCHVWAHLMWLKRVFQGQYLQVGFFSSNSRLDVCEVLANLLERERNILRWSFNGYKYGKNWTLLMFGRQL